MEWTCFGVIYSLDFSLIITYNDSFFYNKRIVLVQVWCNHAARVCPQSPCARKLGKVRTRPRMFCAISVRQTVIVTDYFWTPSSLRLSNISCSDCKPAGVTRLYAPARFRSYYIRVLHSKSVSFFLYIVYLHG